MNIKIPDNLKLVVLDIDNTIHHTNVKEMPKHILDILKYFHKNNVILAIASLNQYAPYILDYYNISHLFRVVEYRSNIDDCRTCEQIEEYYSLKKTNMFQRLIKTLDINFENILFFDDSVLNIIDAKELNIKSICVNAEKLLTWQNVKDGIALFDKRKRRYSHG
jgi:HAD superfamily phosphatase (TIGR01681 family)